MFADSIECNICSQDYSTNLKCVPRILRECGHTVCEECATKMIKEEKVMEKGKTKKKWTIDCPFCHVETEVPNGRSDGLKKNFAVMTLVEDRKEGDEKEKKAESGATNGKVSEVRCSENKDHFASKYCFDCNFDFCDKCFKIGHRLKILAEHRTVPITEKPISLPNCTIHKYNVADCLCKDPACSSSNKVICSTCLVYGEHKGHQSVLVQKIYEETLGELGKSLEAVENNKNELFKKIKAVKRVLDSYKEDSKENKDVEKQINEHFQKIYNVIPKMRSEALRLLRNVREERKQKLENFLKRLELSLSKEENKKSAIKKWKDKSIEELSKSDDWLKGINDVEPKEKFKLCDNLPSLQLILPVIDGTPLKIKSVIRIIAGVFEVQSGPPSKKEMFSDFFKNHCQQNPSNKQQFVYKRHILEVCKNEDEYAEGICSLIYADIDEITAPQLSSLRIHENVEKVIVGVRNLSKFTKFLGKPYQVDKRVTFVQCDHFSTAAEKIVTMALKD